MKTALRFFAAYVLLSAVFGGLALIQSFPDRPTSWVGWLLLFMFVLPVTMAAEFVGELIFDRNPVIQAVERRTKAKRFSWLRVLTALTLTLLVFAAVFGLSRLLG
jgi:hypothetical protein